MNEVIENVMCQNVQHYSFVLLGSKYISILGNACNGDPKIIMVFRARNTATYINQCQGFKVKIHSGKQKFVARKHLYFIERTFIDWKSRDSFL